MSNSGAPIANTKLEALLLHFKAVPDADLSFSHGWGAAKNLLLYNASNSFRLKLAMALIAGKLGATKELATAWEKLVAYGISEQSE